MPTNEQALALEQQLEAARTQLFKTLAPQFAANPALIEGAQARIDELEDRIRARQADEAPQPDGGLSALIGLGDDAADGLGKVPVPVVNERYDDTVTKQRVKAVADLYFIYQHEALGAFTAVLTLRRLFQAGTVRLSDGDGALLLYRFDHRETLRYSHVQRWRAYRRTLGYTNAAPPPGSSPNDRFHPLFVSFVEQVAEYYRDKRVSNVVRERANDPSFGSVAKVRRTGLDLRSNIRNASYGYVNVLRAESMHVLREAFRILGAPDVKGLFGADTAWDVIEEIHARHLGRPQVNASQRSRMAWTGQSILSWLSEGHILTTNRTQFEALLESIAADAEEWLMSARAVGALTAPAPRPGPRKRPTVAAPDLVERPW
jgi:hypothetical protein